MAEAHHAIRGSKPCDVKGCEAEAERSISGDAASEAGLKVDEDLKRVHLCKTITRNTRSSRRADAK